jgi:hypothetical protein
MKIEIEGFVVGGVDVKQDDIVQLVSEGEWRPLPPQFQKEGREKTLVFRVRLPSGKIKEMSLNRTTQVTLVSQYGNDTRNWVNRDLKVHCVTQNVAGKFKQVIYLTPPDWISPTERGRDKLAEALDINEEDIPVVD